MRRIRRVLFIGSLLSLSLTLTACSDFSVPDPTDFFGSEMFNPKKKLPGDRKPVFPEGVPGVSQGVPPDLVKGNQQAGLTQPPPDAAPLEEPKPKAKPKPKPKVAARPVPPPSDDSVPQQPRQGGVTVRPTSGPAQAAPWPSASAPAPQAAPAASPPGQIMWPDPPPPPSR
jgi:hypothetical protein